MVDISGVISSRTSRTIFTVSREVNIVTPFCDGTAADLNTVLKVDAGENGARVYNIADIARADRIEDLGAAPR